MAKKKVVKTIRHYEEGYTYKGWQRAFRFDYGYLHFPLICDDKDRGVSRTVKVKITVEEITD
jgi:hypothetical protein